MTYTIYAYWNSAQLATVMDSIASITASADYLQVFRTLAIIGFLVFIIGMAVGKSQEPLEFFRWFLVIVLIHSVLLIPKVDVVIKDRTGSAAPATRSNIPIGFALFASLTSHVGDWMTRTFETVFAMPDDLQFQKTGLMFGNTVVSDSLQAVPVSPSFRNDITSFINNCTYYDVLAGRISQDALAKSDDIWTVMASTSETHQTPISTDLSGTKICTDAYVDLNTRFTTEITQVKQARGRVLNPTAVNNITAAAMLDSQLVNSYQRLTNISKTSTDILRQNIAINELRDSQMISAQHLDSNSAAIVGAAQAQTEATTNLNYITMARVAERAAPAIRNIIEVICYSVFPIIILLLVLAGEQAGKVLKGYVMSLIWLQLIPPLYAALNFVMTSVSQTSQIGIASSTGTAAVNLINIGQLGQQGLSDLAIAGYMTLFLPVIAWALVKGGEIGGSALFSSLMAGATGSAGHVAGNLAAGNVSQGNVSLDSQSTNNVNSNHYDVAPTMRSGLTQTTDAAGTTTIGADGTYRHQASQSSLGFSANFGQKIGNALSSEASSRNEVASRETDSATQMKTAALVERMGIVRSFADSKGTNNLDDVTQGSRSGMAVSKLEQVAENVNKRLGLSANSNVGRQVVGEMAMGGSIGSPGGGKGAAGILSKIISANIGLSDKTITSAQDTKSLESALGYARDQLKSSNITADQGLYKDFRSSEAYQWAKQNRSESVSGEEAAMTKAEQHTHNAETAKSQAFSLSDQARIVSENWLHSSMNYEGYIANRLHQEGQMEAFHMLYQTDPQRAAQMAAGYLAETNFDVSPNIQPLTNDLSKLQMSSPALAGRTLSSEAASIGKPSDTTQSAHTQHKDHVRGDGFHQEQLNNNVKAEVANAGDSAKQAIDTQGNSIDRQRLDATNIANKELSRANQITGMKGPTDHAPTAGSAPAQHDTIHDDLFGKTPKE